MGNQSIDPPQDSDPLCRDQNLERLSTNEVQRDTSNLLSAFDGALRCEVGQCHNGAYEQEEHHHKGHEDLHVIAFR
jgi:hypothetical protein